ncbi:MAG: AAA family ATPase, partial [Nanoarchaeota archaeon]|nr:AAA family ATPase [Nanoarchaeota archaeon]
MDKQKIINALKETNIWWKSDFKPVYKDREIYSEIKKYLGEKQMIALTGLRRVGKTTLMLKIVMDKINSGFSKENIMLFSFDNFFDVEIKKIIDVYFELLDKDETEEYLLIFDEIQKLKGWEEQIKRIYDINLNFKIIFSGSESLFIHKKSRESLAGRIFEFRIDVLSFKEYLGFLNLEYNNLELYDNDIKKTLKRYLLTNGFPELVLSEPDIIKKYL